MTKPDWAIMMLNAQDMERQASMIRSEAQGRRCGVEESGGAQCTRDGQHEGNHRHEREDLP